MVHSGEKRAVSQSVREWFLEKGIRCRQADGGGCIGRRRRASDETPARTISASTQSTMM